MQLFVLSSFSDKHSRRVRDLHLLKKLSAVLDQVKQDEGSFNMNYCGLSECAFLFVIWGPFFHRLVTCDKTAALKHTIQHTPRLG